MKRRRFLHQSVTASILPFLPASVEAINSSQSQRGLEIHIFSKHLQFLDYIDLGKAVKDMGFAGADLTVRPGGHVLPQNVTTELPKAVDALRNAGVESKMMTTAITDASDPVNQNVLETAAHQGIQYYRLGWFKYPETGSIEEAVEGFNQKTIEIARLNERCGIYGSYQNHSGAYYSGASLWELKKILEQTSLPHQGCQFDIRHAVVEGGLSWPTSFRIIKDRINTIVLKDFKWVQESGQWKLLNTPIGEGMVDFDAYFKLLKTNNISVPVSLHLEYDLGGAEHGRKKFSIPKTAVYEAMVKDLKNIQMLWEKA